MAALGVALREALGGREGVDPVRRRDGADGRGAGDRGRRPRPPAARGDRARVHGRPRRRARADASPARARAVRDRGGLHGARRGGRRGRPPRRRGGVQGPGPRTARGVRPRRRRRGQARRRARCDPSSRVTRAMACAAAAPTGEEAALAQSPQGARPSVLDYRTFVHSAGRREGRGRRLRRRQPPQPLLGARARGGEPFVTTDRARCVRRRSPSSPASGTWRARPRARANRRRRGAARAGRPGAAAPRHLRRHAAPVRGRARKAARGLGLSAGPCRAARRARRVPHMGWNTLAARRASRCSTGSTARTSTSPTRTLRSPTDDERRSPPRSITRGRVVAAVESGPLVGVQFHPERSGPAGARAPRERPGDGQEARDPLPRRRRRPCRQGRAVRESARHGRSGRARDALLGARRRRARLPRHHGDAGGPRADCSSSSTAPRRSSRSRSPSAAASRSVDDGLALLRAGADKVAVNRAALDEPGLLDRLADAFGSQAVVCAIDARGGEVVTHAGRNPRGIDAVAWAQEAVAARRRRAARHLDRRRRHARRLRPGADAERSPARSACP